MPNKTKKQNKKKETKGKEEGKVTSLTRTRRAHSKTEEKKEQ